MTAKLDKPRTLDQRDLAILRALRASATWTSRAAIAAMLDKIQLHPEDQIALDVLVREGRVEKKPVGTGKSHAGIVYRIAQGDQEGRTGGGQ